MKTIITLLLFLSSVLSTQFTAQEVIKQEESNLSQFYSGKFGFYNPGNGLVNGLLFGIDGITEFNHYNFFLSGAADLYTKKSISIFSTTPGPRINDQLIALLPLHVNAAYRALAFPKADTRLYIGAGAGYYLYFYTVDYTTQSGGGGIFGTVTSQTKSESRSGGNMFYSAFARVNIGKIFVEPRFYFAARKEDKVENFSYRIDPSGFAITLGFQY